MTVRELINELMDVYNKNTEIELLYSYEDEEEDESIMGFDIESVHDDSYYIENDKAVFICLKLIEEC